MLRSLRPATALDTFRAPPEDNSRTNKDYEALNIFRAS